MSSICIEINDLCHRDTALVLQSGGSQQNTRILLCCLRNVLRLAASHQSDGQAGAIPETCQAGLNQSIVVLHLACRAHFYHYCSPEDLYVLSHSYSNENTDSDSGRLTRVLLLNVFFTTCCLVTERDGRLFNWTQRSFVDFRERHDKSVGRGRSRSHLCCQPEWGRGVNLKGGRWD